MSTTMVGLVCALLVFSTLPDSELKADDNEVETAVVQALIEVARDPDQQVRLAAFVALRGWPLSDALLATFRRGLKDEDPRIRQIALAALVAHQGTTEEFLSELIAALNDRALMSTARRKLLEIGEPAIPKLIDAMETGATRIVVIHLLGDMELKKSRAVVLKVLINALSDDDNAVRLAATRSLGKLARSVNDDELDMARKEIQDREEQEWLTGPWRTLKDTIVSATRDGEAPSIEAQMTLLQSLFLAFELDEQGDEAVAARKELLEKLKSGESTPQPVNQFRWRELEATLNRVVAAQMEVVSGQALYEGGKATLDLIIDSQRRANDARISFARELFDLLPILDDDEVKGVADRLQGLMELRILEDSRDLALITWNEVYKKMKVGLAGGTAQAEHQARQRYYFYEANVNAAKARLAGA